MLLGPLNILRQKHNPVHSAVRRDVGITAGIAALVHTVLGLQVHMGGTLMGYFTVPSPGGPTAVAFVAANYIGLLSAAILAVLVSISNNVGVRSLGLPRWKKIQRAAYVAAAAAVVHGVIYQVLESRRLAIIIFVVGTAAVVVVVQVRGARARRETAPVSESSQTDAGQQ